jgi:hypothetical protein
VGDAAIHGKGFHGFYPAESLEPLSPCRSVGRSEDSQTKFGDCDH